jgi:uncharacterized repeat protein (TIGR03803 family)
MSPGFRFTAICICVIAECWVLNGQPRPASAVSADTALMSSLETKKFRILHEFGEGARSDGYAPQASLIDVKGTLYGTTWMGGATECVGGCGVVFSITKTGKQRVIHSFGVQPDGYYPASIIGVDGVIYGTTLKGGAYNFGTLFRVSAAGAEKVLYSFGKGSDGRYPRSPLIDVSGMLYGTTVNGGTQGRGTMFRVSTSGVEHVLHSFGDGADGAFPYGGLDNVDGTLFGTTYYGGSYNDGTVFRIDPSGRDERIIHSFRNAHGSDGYFPAAGLVDSNGILYGTTLNGGSANYYTGQVCNCGTVFSLDPKTGLEHVLHSFSGTLSPSAPPDGRSPEASMIVVNGVLYGTTATGGAQGGPDGSVFRITVSGAEQLVYSFGPGNYNPVTSLTDADGTLYGTTQTGGTYSGGIVFALAP